MANLYYLRNEPLSAELAAKLAPFVAAYRPDPYREKSRVLELLLEGVKPLSEGESFSEELAEVYFEEHGYYPNEKPGRSV